MGHYALVEVLAEARASINSRDEAGSTPTHKAAAHGHRLCLQQLLRFRANLNQADDRGWTPVHAAAFHGHLNCITFFRQHDVDLSSVDKDGYTPLHYAVAENHFRTVKYLLKHCTQSILATETVQGETPLDLAVRLSRKKIRRYLEFATEATIEGGDDQLLLHSAAARGDLDTIKRLLDDGVFIDLHDSTGSTALHAAAASGHSAAVRYLVRRGANRAACNFYGELAYDVALRCNSKECASLLEPRDPDTIALTGRVADAYGGDGNGDDDEEDEETPAQRQTRLREHITRLTEELQLAKIEFRESGGRLAEDVEAELEEQRRQQHLTALTDRVAVLDGELTRERTKREHLERVLQQSSEYITELTARLHRFEDAHREALTRVYWLERKPVRGRTRTHRARTP
ncbi:integrin linked kinase [Salpingoeca rosetta]|uniref:Integrin linked kinase n=1 Tax=Salpingoeca rosetta (strain ATCC 50818 / BSB-021) TaxID=946362 RepID=F2U8Y9_SALR5|nr:integrin linked kinase [Salpingoeca rosetta]EGD73192.1 integrin linked kinase [Salpingoeca rosetta]|eukprot:XP_004994223.1 integrin linked kinase [Salpingoeca rosetta]